MPAARTTIEALNARFDGLQFDEFREQTRLCAPQPAMLDCLMALKDDFGFDLLVDITCVDYLNYRDATDRFGLTYLLANTEDNQRITLRIMLNEPHLTVPSAYGLWEGADWLEREVYDMFGITFEGHPDLRRILLPDGFAAHPLRKDYPMQGRGERHNFPFLARRDA
jgi:NADH-quinone oxidoreductase subunit C